MQPIYRAIGGRKLFVSLLVFITATVLLIVGKLDDASWVWAVSICATGYGVSNVMVKQIRKSHKANEAN